jgi:hypothetical protein
MTPLEFQEFHSRLSDNAEEIYQELKRTSLRLGLLYDNLELSERVKTTLGRTINALEILECRVEGHQSTPCTRCNGGEA